MSLLGRHQEPIPNIFETLPEQTPRAVGYSVISRWDGLPIIGTEVGETQEITPIAVTSGMLASELEKLKVYDKVPPIDGMKRILNKNGIKFNEDASGSGGALLDAISNSLVNPADPVKWVSITTPDSLEIGPEIEHLDKASVILSKTKDATGLSLRSTLKTDFIPDHPASNWHEKPEPLHTAENFERTLGEAEIAVTLAPTAGPDRTDKPLKNHGTGAFIKGMIESLGIRVAEKVSPKAIAGLAIGVVAVKLAFINPDRKK